ncbi:MAG: hypothetical protein RLZZ385_2653 [Pseudomonadota bacterium]|jgi:hypothetical protein
MIERRRHERATVGSRVSLSHPLLGVVTGEVRNVSRGGLCLTTDKVAGCYVMMELQARLHSEEGDDPQPDSLVQMVRIKGQEIALRFLTPYGPPLPPTSRA